MPENRYYTVTQEREVKISASSPSEAVEIATKVFRGESPDSITTPGQIRSQIREKDIQAREDI